MRSDITQPRLNTAQSAHIECECLTDDKTRKNYRNAELEDAIRVTKVHQGIGEEQGMDRGSTEYGRRAVSG